MKKLLIMLLFGSIILSSCQKKTDVILSPEKQELALNKKDLIESIQKTLIEQGTNEKVISINNIKYFDKKKELVAIITYSTEVSNDRTIGIIKEFGSEIGKVKETHVTCKGTCSSGTACSLIGNYPGGVENIECSCSGCKIVVTISKNTLSEKDEKNKRLNKLAEQSYFETFGKKSISEVLITDYTIKDEFNAKVEIFEFKGDDNKGSAFMILTPKVDGLSAGGTLLVNKKSYEIDCTGTCDCRERFTPSTGATECTCSPCKMKVTELP